MLFVLLLLSPSVTVDLLSHQRLARLSLQSSGRTVQLAVDGDHLMVDGVSHPQPLPLPPARWRCGRASHTSGEAFLLSCDYDTALSVDVNEHRLRFRADLPLETYVARVVASETLIGTPAAALAAQAVVARTYVRANHRHADVDACDLTHCQVFARNIPSTHLAAATAAALMTHGQILQLDGGIPANVSFFAECAGQTADPQEVLGSAETGSASVSDGCIGPEWHVDIERERFEQIVQTLFAMPVHAEALRTIVGQGGYIAQVIDQTSGRAVAGERFALALDQALGWGQVKSPHFVLSLGDRVVHLVGRGHGHGVGLCQTGARALAKKGLDYKTILRTYFPHAVLAEKR